VRLYLLSTLIFFFTLLSGCASSDVSREAASNVDMGVQNANNLASNAASSSFSESYQNSSQASKGAVIGGATGAVAGGLSGIGVFPGLAGGVILGASYGSYLDSRTTLKDKLENRGITVVELGDQILIMIPSSRLFEGMSYDVTPQAYSNLGLVAKYINGFTKMTVRVAAFTNDTGSSRVALALSEQQAQSVAKALLANGVDARVLYSVGYGGTRLVDKNTSEWDENDNYRVEITLEKLYV
jgi:outer membrane protein OmpA-like peptidoglycan-associated protein